MVPIDGPEHNMYVSSFKLSICDRLVVVTRHHPLLLRVCVLSGTATSGAARWSIFSIPYTTSHSQPTAYCAHASRRLEVCVCVCLEAENRNFQRSGKAARARRRRLRRRCTTSQDMLALCHGSTSTAARAGGVASRGRLVSAIAEAGGGVAEAEFCFGLPGTIAPAGQWDPANLLRGRSKAEVYNGASPS